MSSNNLLSFPCRLYLNCQKWDSVKNRNQCHEQFWMCPVMACLWSERWKLLSWALQVQGWPKSFTISIKRRQLATRNSSSNRINIGMPGNNLLMGIEALKIIQWLVNPKFSGKSSSWHNQESVKVSIFPVNIEAIIPGFASCRQFCAFPFTAPELLLHVYPGACMLSHVQLFETPWTAAPQAPLRVGFSRQEYWSGLPFPYPDDLPDPRIKPSFLSSSTLEGAFFTTLVPPGQPLLWYWHKRKFNQESHWVFPDQPME